MAPAISTADSPHGTKPGQYDVHCDEADLDTVCAGMNRSLRTVVVVTSRPGGPAPWNFTAFEVLDADVFIIESTARGYSRIRQVMPSLIMIFMDEDDAAGYQLMSMLKVDRAVSHIPVITVAFPHEPDEPKAAGSRNPAPVPAPGWQ